jgi:hypothetical protein
MIPKVPKDHICSRFHFEIGNSIIKIKLSILEFSFHLEYSSAIRDLAVRKTSSCSDSFMHFIAITFSSRTSNYIGFPFADIPIGMLHKASSISNLKLRQSSRDEACCQDLNQILTSQNYHRNIGLQRTRSSNTDDV